MDKRFEQIEVDLAKMKAALMRDGSSDRPTFGFLISIFSAMR